MILRGRRNGSDRVVGLYNDVGSRQNCRGGDERRDEWLIL